MQFDTQALSNPPEKLKPYIKALLPIIEKINLFSRERHLKSTNLLLWSASPNMGKTALAQVLNLKSPVYF